MDITDQHGFSSDRPIHNIDEDLLGRSKFSLDLAKAITSWHGNDSLVVALHGDWGSGKSSIKNMALNELEKVDKNKPDIIEFSPWEWAAQDKITSSFFKEISTTIGLKDKSADGKKLAKLLKKYGRYLNTGETITSGLASALPILFILATLLGIGDNFFDKEWIKHVSTTLLSLLAIWGAWLAWGKKLLTQLADNTDKSAKEEELTLNQLRQALTDLLRKRDKSVIIVLDDLDRLTTQQLQMVFQLVKANTEFPNVVFVLLFQRNLVEDKLTDGKQTGREYLEKIIQVPFDIPKVETSRMHNLLFEKINEIISRNEFAIANFNSTYWGNVFHSSLANYFTNLRNVYRFTSTLSFHFSIYEGKNAFEVNPVDLIAIECIRIFEPDIYKQISHSKHFFTEANSIKHGEDRNIEKEKLNKIISLTKKSNQEKIKNLLHLLFPPVDRVLGTSYPSETYDFWLRDMRICHPSNFDKYFLFSIPNGELSHSELQEMLSLTSDSSSFTSFIKTIYEKNILKNALGQFMAYIEKVPIDNSRSFICSILNICDEVGNDDFSFSLSSNNYMTMYVEKTLEKIKDIDERGSLLFECFQRPEAGLSTIESILLYEENRRSNNDRNTLFSDNTFINLKRKFVEKLNLLSEDKEDTLINNPHFGSFVHRWKLWGSDEKVSQWLTEQAKKPEHCLILLKCFAEKGFSHGSRDLVSRKIVRVKLDNIEEFLPYDLLEDSLKHLNRENLDSSDQEVIDAFIFAIEKRKKP